LYPRDAVTIEGEVLEFASSEHGRRFSCRTCGSPVYSHYEIPDEIDLYPGSFDKDGLWKPTYELWRVRREPWLPEFANVRRSEKDRPQWRRTEP
jgi:hypothetical protein